LTLKRHTNLGESTMEDIGEKGTELGYEYLAFTEHNPSQKGHTDHDIVEILKESVKRLTNLITHYLKLTKMGT